MHTIHPQASRPAFQRPQSEPSADRAGPPVLRATEADKEDGQEDEEQEGEMNDEEMDDEETDEEKIEEEKNIEYVLRYKAQPRPRRLYEVGQNNEFDDEITQPWESIPKLTRVSWANPRHEQVRCGLGAVVNVGFDTRPDGGGSSSVQHITRF